MILDFIGSLATGLGLLGVTLFVNRVLLRSYFGRWVYPATVAFGMVAFSVWAEYTWTARTLDAQPQLRLASQNANSVFYRPWTFVWPQVTRIIAVDLSQTRTHPAQPDLVLTRVILMGKWEPVRGVMVVYNCADPARADLREGVEFNEDGTLEGAEWLPLAADDPVLRAACTPLEEGSDARVNGA